MFHSQLQHIKHVCDCVQLDAGLHCGVEHTVRVSKLLFALFIQYKLMNYLVSYNMYKGRFKKKKIVSNHLMPCALSSPLATQAQHDFISKRNSVNNTL